MENNRKLSSILINKNYQGKFLITFGSFGILLGSIFFYTIHFIFEQLQELTLANGTPAASPIFEQLKELECNMFTMGGGFFGASMMLFIFLGFRFTHRTAGVLHHFKTEFSKMEEQNELHHLKLRDGDFFRDTEAAFNKLVDSVKKK